MVHNTQNYRVPILMNVINKIIKIPYSNCILFHLHTAHNQIKEEYALFSHVVL
jgi:hypothetical protein